MEPSVEFVATADGARLACKRLAADGGRPVIMLHGLAVNADIWLVPDVHAADGTLRYRSLARLLHAHGHDVWLLNLRGHGAPDPHSAPPAGQEDWRVDHFAVWDLPAVVAHVRSATGRAPLLVGASMGAMTIAAWLLGANGQAPGDAATLRIGLDADAAAERAVAIAGAVLIEFPAALRWPASMYDADGRLRWRELWSARRPAGPDRNYAFELLAQWAWLEAILRATGGVDLKWLRAGAGGAWQNWVDERLEALGAPLARWYRGARHFDPETFTRGLRPAVDHMKAGVLAQLAACVRARAFVSGGPETVTYSDAYARIATPTLVVLGGRDRIANADVTRTVFFERITATDKTLRVFDDLAHGEFEYAPVAYERVYPAILDWIAARA